MAEPIFSRVGAFTVEVDGDWDIEDLLALSEAFAESYGFFYSLVVIDDEAAKRIHNTIQKRFWSGDIETRRFGKLLYGMVPKEESLKIRSFSYASPGAMTLVGILPALWMAARVARAWAAAGTDILELWKKVEKYFEQRKKRRKPKQSVSLDAELAQDVDDARTLVFQAGGLLGFDDLSTERIIDLTGNPITALKYLVALGNEARKLTGLENAGLLKLPVPPSGPLPLGRAPRKGLRAGVKVETLKRRRPRQTTRLNK